MSDESKYGTCVDCGRRIRLRDDGTVRAHGYKRRVDERRCAGSGLLPHEGEASA